jgi:hypothetical protein
MSKLSDLAAAISPSSPKIKAFAQEAAVEVDALAGQAAQDRTRVAALEARVAALEQQPAPTPTPTPTPVPTPTPSGLWWGFTLSPPNGDWNQLNAATSLAQLQKAQTLGMNCPRLSGHDFAAQNARNLGFKQWVTILGAGKRFPDSAGVIAYCKKWPEAIISPGNELNIGGSTWTASALAAAQLGLKQAMVAAGVPNKLLLSSVGNSASTQGNLLPLAWCQQMAAAGCVYPAAFDIADYHMYGESPQNYDNWMHVWTADGTGKSCQSVFGNPPFILSEFGCNIQSVGGDPARQAKAVTAWMTQIKTLPNCLGGMWYTILDHTDAGTGWGLEDPMGVHRPSWDAFKAGAA